MMGRLLREMREDALGWSVFLLAFIVMVMLAVEGQAGSELIGYAWPLGVIATWRYGWQLIHFVRSQWYGKLRFPRWRREADLIAADPSASPRHIGILVTSYRISAMENHEVYTGLFEELARHEAAATVVASVTDDGDARLVHQLHQQSKAVHRIQLVTQIQAGTGKRDAMVAALRVLQSANPDRDGVVILMDGDTVVTEGLFARVFPFFRMMPDLGALTVNNHAEVRGGDVARAWYAMRFALRTLYMNSLSLSRRVLCLTGRFSVFRAEVALDDAFVDRVGNDVLEHWRLGPVRMLTGDDKSTWFHCLKNRWAMIYVPDAYVRCLEELPPGGFLRASAMLMHRWFGNMLRNSDRSIALGPGRMGLFTWWCLVDQRLTVFTSLSGPIFIMVLVMSGYSAVVPVALSGIMITRFLQTMNAAYHGGRASPLVPLLLLHQQYLGSALKLNIQFHLDRQKWTRQNIATGARGSFARLNDLYAQSFKAISIIVLVSFVSLLASMTIA